MNILEDKIISLQQDLIKIKSSQNMGGDNYRVFTEKNTLIASGNSRYWLYYESNSSLPLCQWLFTIKENGVAVLPKGSVVNTIGNSRGTYDYIYNWGIGRGPNLYNPAPKAGLYNPKINLVSLLVSIPSGVTSSIEITCKSTQQGIIRVEQTSL